jgi:hypothetical protein
LDKLSDFSVFDINHADRIIILEDKNLGLYVDVPFQDKELLAVNVVEPYAILLTYEDGSTEKKRILE